MTTRPPAVPVVAAGPITLRRATPSDAPAILTWRREPSAARYQPLKDRSLDALREELAEALDRPLDASFTGSARFIIVCGEADAGWLTIQRVDRDDQDAGIGYTVTERYRGRGIASSAVRVAIALAFGPLDLGRLAAVSAVDNVASRRVLERNGFRFEGIARGLLIIRGERVDHATYGLLATDVRPPIETMEDRD
ncbi:MAG: hypothetical protein AVDCRST_MAG70-2061 [uncultured Thermomicrobiales bacterium]|uniref:N-acetyltransferase domain-containing protein n=1 Tax=uncultured Thermomicrobiales bacterium TaxID=1645740 RepID=A0A6J4V425_9BACT|nr:MAG: hypothetical protein AVDCRST_MAG70-2061 [uncultured Thermomicrobiales bacterium]